MSSNPVSTQLCKTVDIYVLHPYCTILDVGIAPQNCSVVVGSSANVTCLPSILSSSLTYQWLHNGTIVKNETTAVLNLTNVKETDSGAYQCIVTISDTNATSNGAQFHVLYKPVSSKSNMVYVKSILFMLFQLLLMISARPASSVVQWVS